MFRLLQAINTGLAAEPFLGTTDSLLFFSGGGCGEADGVPTLGSEARPLLRGLERTDSALDSLETVRYSLCSVSSWGEVAGFSCSLERLRAGEEDLSRSRQIWGDNLGGLSGRGGSELSQLGLDTDRGVRILMGLSSTLVGILLISFNVILVGDLELCISEEVILCRPHGIPGCPALARASVGGVASDL